MILNANDLKPFDVIRLPYTYPGETPEFKRFVFLCHEAEYAICLKTTSKVLLYENNPDLKAGVVFYPKDSISVFEVDTAVQPDNPHPVSHKDINLSIQRGKFEHLGAMPPEFKVLLTSAVGASKTMKPERKRSLIARL